MGCRFKAVAAIIAVFSSVNLCCADGYVRLYAENDAGFSDNKYSHGTRIENCLFNYDKPEWMDRALNGFMLWGKGDFCRRMAYVGQHIYTPDERDVVEPVLWDRPYAGWLYLGYGVEESDSKRSDTIEIQAGVVGPHAYAKEMQTWWHENVFHCRTFKGWDNQLRDEVGINLIRRKAQRVPLVGDGRLGCDLIFQETICAGNVFTMAEVGGLVRAGRNIPKSFGENFMSPRDASVLRGADSGWLDFYLFAGARGRAMARNIFLDGNTFVESQSVDKRPFNGDAFAGVNWRIGTFEMMFATTWRNKEFYGEESGHGFHSVSLSHYF